MRQLAVENQGYSPEDLFAEWQRLSMLRTAADEQITAIRHRWEQTTDETAKARLWDCLDQAWPHFEVLSAWTELFYSAWVFATRGPDSAFLPPAGCQVHGAPMK